MRTRRQPRRFVPTVAGLPLRIAPTIFLPAPDTVYTQPSNPADDSTPGDPTTTTGSGSLQPTSTSCC